MILTVTPNPAVDMTYQLGSFDRGESIRVDAAAVRAGGKGLNVARVARQTGSEVVVVTTAGGATGRELADDLAASGLLHRVVPVAPATRRSVAIVDASRGETTIMNERGHALSSNERQRLAAAILDAMASQEPAIRCVVGAGSLPPDTPDTFYADLVRDAHDRSIPAIIDAVGPALLLAAKAGADVVKPNRSELQHTTGETDPQAGARRLIDHGARLVLVSLGEDGMLAVDARDPDHVYRARLPRALDGNPTGAGDAGVAAVAQCIAEGRRDPSTVLRRATAYSAAAVLMPVAGEIAVNYRELELLLQVTG